MEARGDYALLAPSPRQLDRGSGTKPVPILRQYGLRHGTAEFLRFRAFAGSTAGKPDGGREGTLDAGVSFFGTQLRPVSLDHSVKLASKLRAEFLGFLVRHNAVRHVGTSDHRPSVDGAEKQVTRADRGSAWRRPLERDSWGS